jgi:hypothetical protein
MIKLRRIKRGWGGLVTCMREKRNTFKVLVVEPKGRRPLGKPKRRWGYNIEMDLACF